MCFLSQIRYPKKRFFLKYNCVYILSRHYTQCVFQNSKQPVIIILKQQPKGLTFNMYYQIAICDDSKIDTQYITNFVKCWAQEANISVHIDAFPSAEVFLFHYEEKKDYDILLLDVEMGAMDGVTLAKTLRKENDTIQIVFLTGYSDYISEGYEVDALHYLLKPVQKEKLFSVLYRALDKVKKNE